MSVNLAIARAAQLYPGKCAVRTDRAERNWEETRHRVSCIAGGLFALGLQRGSRIAILAGNSAAHMELTYAAIWAGIVVVPLNTRLSPPEMVEIVKDSGSTALAYDSGYAEAAARVVKTAEIEAVLEIGDDAVEFKRLLDATPAPLAVFGGNDVLGIYYTGGTTGRPKGVELSHNSFHLTALDQVVGFALNEAAVYLHAAPYFHLADCALGNSVTYVGGTHVFTPDLSPNGIVGALTTLEVNVLSLVPTMYHDLLDQAPSGSLGQVKKAIYGAAPITANLLQRVRDAMPDAELYQAYGQSEIGGACLILPAEDHVAGGPRLAAAGVATKSVHVRIADEDGNEVSTGTAGEIQVAGLRIMNGYRGMPEATDQAMTNGWLKTGDVGIMDANGYVTVVDRLKDMIVSGGENVFCSEVENVLASHPLVQSVAVVGLPDERWGERVHAFVVTQHQADLSDQDLMQYTRDRISNYKCPKGVTFLDELPLSAVGKIRKDVLRANFRDG